MRAIPKSHSVAENLHCHGPDAFPHGANYLEEGKRRIPCGTGPWSTQLLTHQGTQNYCFAKTTRIPKQVQRGERKASRPSPKQPCLCRACVWMLTSSAVPGEILATSALPVSLHSLGAYFSHYSKHNLSRDSLDSFVNLSRANLCVSFVLFLNTWTEALSERKILHSCYLIRPWKMRILLG